MDLRKIRRYLGGKFLDALVGSIFTAAIAYALSRLVLMRADYWQRLGEARWPIVIIVTSVVGLLAFFLLARSRGIYDYSYRLPDFRYEILQKTHVYRVLDHERLEYVRVIKVKALQDGLNEFIDRYFWTGDDDTLPVRGRHVHKITLMEDTSGMYRFIRVQLEKSLRRGEEYDFEVRWPAIRQWRTSRPFVSGSTDDPTHRLVFKVNIPSASRGSDEAVCEIYRAVESLVPIESEVREFDRDGAVEWVVNRPKLFHHYRLRWSWTEADA
jgi:hypothetical protein